MKLAAFIGFLYLMLCGNALAAIDAACYFTFYQTKNMQCIDTLVIGNPPGFNTMHIPQEEMVGFLAELFSNYPQQREHVLNKDGVLSNKNLYVEALFRAGLVKEAAAYAKANDISQDQYKNLIPISLLKPDSDTAIPGILIGAYRASGNKEYITRILNNFVTADDARVSDAFRIALTMDVFGCCNISKAPVHQKTMAKAVCKKYGCGPESDPGSNRNFSRTMVLSGSYFYIHALAQNDGNIKEILSDFFNKNDHLKQLLTSEENAYSSYAASLKDSEKNDNPDILKSLAIYENLGSAKDFMDSIKMH